MKWTLVRYRAKPEQADENQRLSAAVFNELQDKAPAGTALRRVQAAGRYFRPSRHAEDGGPALSALETFRAFSEAVSGSAAPSRPSPPSRSWSATMACWRSTRSTEDCTMQHDIVSREEWPAARTLLG